jgi:hypothetical protein
VAAAAAAVARQDLNWRSINKAKATAPTSPASILALRLAAEALRRYFRDFTRAAGSLGTRVCQVAVGGTPPSRERGRAEHRGT